MAGEGKENAVDIKVLEQKIDKGETLTKEEEQFLLQEQPAPEGYNKGQGPQDAPQEGQEAAGAQEKAKEGETAQEAAGAAEKAQEELKSRAKTAGLPETATKEEVEAAEAKAKQEADDKDPFVRLERALEENKDKPDHQVKISEDWTAREKAYFWQMRRDRKRAQDAEAERDAARFKLTKLEKKPDEKPAEMVVEEEDPFKGRDDTDFLTVKEARALQASLKKQKEQPVNTGIFVQHPVVQNFLKGCDAYMEKEKPDYAEVMELTPDIINNNPAYQKEVAETLLSGGNPALKMYELIKGDPEFPKLFPAAQTRVQARKSKTPEKPAETPKKEDPKPAKTAEDLRKEKEAKEAEEAMIKNNGKPKTSGHASTEKLEGTDYTMEQIASMSDREFSKLPKKTREKYLELYG